jgi:hypothetical protein
MSVARDSSFTIGMTNILHLPFLPSQQPPTHPPCNDSPHSASSPASVSVRDPSHSAHDGIPPRCAPHHTRNRRRRRRARWFPPRNHQARSSLPHWHRTSPLIQPREQGKKLKRTPGRSVMTNSTYERLSSDTMDTLYDHLEQLVEEWSPEGTHGWEIEYSVRPPSSHALTFLTDPARLVRRPDLGLGTTRNLRDQQATAQPTDMAQ